MNYEKEIGFNSPMRSVRKLLNHPRYFSKLADDLPIGRGHFCVVGLVQDKRNILSAGREKRRRFTEQFKPGLQLARLFLVNV